MVKPYKSDVRQLLCRMINTYDRLKEQRSSVVLQKRQCIHEIEMLTSGISNKMKPRLEAVLQKLKNLDNIDFNEKQHMKNISVMSGVSERTLWTIKKEGLTNKGVWKTPGTKRASRATKVNIDNDDQCAIRNKINEYYLCKKKLPPLRKLLPELREAIQFDGSRETLRKILKNMGYNLKKNSEISASCLGVQAVFSRTKK